MNSRERILNAVKANQPPAVSLPPTDTLMAHRYENHADQYATVLGNIGGEAVFIQSLEEVSNYISEHFQQGHHLVGTVDGIAQLKKVQPGIDPHALETVELAVLHAAFAVAENGAVWIPEDQLQVRVLPFICQHLAVIVQQKNIVHHMHEAYEKIGNADYGFGVFIAGPSKTADIEQSLVLGAHGPRGMTVFIMKEASTNQ